MSAYYSQNYTQTYEQQYTTIAKQEDHVLKLYLRNSLKQLPMNASQFYIISAAPPTVRDAV